MVALVVSLAFLALSAWLTVRRIIVLRSRGQAEGMITEYERRDIDDSTSYHAVVTFVDHLAVRHHFPSSAGHSQPKPLVGTKVPVRYLLRDPEVAFVSTFFHMWAAPVGAAAISLGAFIAWLKV